MPAKHALWQSCHRACANMQCRQFPALGSLGYCCRCSCAATNPGRSNECVQWRAGMEHTALGLTWQCHNFIHCTWILGRTSSERKAALPLVQQVGCWVCCCAPTLHRRGTLWLFAAGSPTTFAHDPPASLYSMCGATLWLTTNPTIAFGLGCQPVVVSNANIRSMRECTVPLASQVHAESVLVVETGTSHPDALLLLVAV